MAQKDQSDQENNSSKKESQPQSKRPKNSRSEGSLSDVLESFSKPKVEETHTRATFLIKNETLAKLDELARGKGKGFKTKLLNYVLEKAVDELLEMEKKRPR